MGIIKIIMRCHYLVIREREKRKERKGGGGWEIGIDIYTIDTVYKIDN